MQQIELSALLPVMQIDQTSKHCAIFSYKFLLICAWHANVITTLALIDLFLENGAKCVGENFDQLDEII